MTAVKGATRAGPSPATSTGAVSSEHRAQPIHTTPHQEEDVAVRVDRVAMDLLEQYNRDQTAYDLANSGRIQQLSNRYTITSVGLYLYTAATGKVEQVEKDLKEQKAALQERAKEVLAALISHHPSTTHDEMRVFINARIHPILGHHHELFLTPTLRQQYKNLTLFAPLIISMMGFHPTLRENLASLYTLPVHPDEPPTTIATALGATYTALGATYNGAGELAWKEGRLDTIKTTRDELFIESLSDLGLEDQLARLREVTDPSPVMRGRIAWLENQIATPNTPQSRTRSNTARGLTPEQLIQSIRETLEELDAINRELQPEDVDRDVKAAIDHGLSQEDVDQIVVLLTEQIEALPSTEANESTIYVLERELEQVTAASRKCVVHTIATTMRKSISLEAQLKREYNQLKQAPDYLENAALEREVQRYISLDAEESRFPVGVDGTWAREETAALYAAIPPPPVDPVVQARQRRDSNSRSVTFLSSREPQNAYQRIHLIDNVLLLIDEIGESSVTPVELTILYSVLCHQWMYLCQTSIMPPDEARLAKGYFWNHGSKIRGLIKTFRATSTQSKSS